MSKKLKKQEEEEREEGEEEAEGEGEGEEEEKSESLTQDDLQKSLDQLEEIAVEGDSDSRKDVLLAKAQKGDLDKAETDELYQLLGGEPKNEEPALVEEVTKGLEQNDDLQKALDVSDYLREQHTELCKSLDILATEIDKRDNRQHQFNLVLAKAVSETGRMVKAMSEKLGVIEQQPARAPKAQRSPAAKPLEKGFANGAPSGDELSKSEILDTLEDMIAESVKKGMAGNTEDGIDLSVAAAKVESLNHIDPRLLARVKAHRARGGAAR